MDINVLYTQLNYKKKDLEKLKNLHLRLNNLEMYLNDVWSNLKQASLSMEKAGSINGHPFDNGKTSEYAIYYKKMYMNIENANLQLNADIKTLENEIDSINNEIYRLQNSTSTAKTTNSNKSKPDRVSKTNKISPKNKAIDNGRWLYE